MGLPWKPSKPAAMIFWRSWAMTDAVTSDDRDRPRRGISTKFPERLDPVHAGQLNIHEDQGGAPLAGQLHPLFACLRLDRVIPLDLEGVPHQLQVLGIVLDDQDQLIRHDRPAG